MKKPIAKSSFVFAAAFILLAFFGSKSKAETIQDGLHQSAQIERLVTVRQ